MAIPDTSRKTHYSEIEEFWRDNPTRILTAGEHRLAASNKAYRAAGLSSPVKDNPLIA